MTERGPAPTAAGAAPTGNGTIDAVRELREARLGRFHWVLIAGIALATVFDGYDTLNPSYVIHFTLKPWHLSHSAAGFMVSAGLIGFLVGSLAHGPVADRIGRRPVLLASLAWSGVFSLLTAVAGDGYGSFVALRFLTGLGLGVIMPLGTAYINEFTPTRSANWVASLAISGYSVGGVLAALVGIYLTPGHGWPVLYWIGAGSLVLAVLLLPLLPESVQFLGLRGRDRQIERVLTAVRPERRAAYAGAGFLRVRDRAPVAEMLATVVSPRYRRTTLALWICAFFVLFDIYGLSGWLPTVMEQRGDGFAASFAFGAILQVAGIAGGLVVALRSDRTGRSLGRGLTPLLALATVAMVLVSFGGSTATDVVLVAAAGFGIIGGQFVLDNFTAQVYPVHLRSTGTGLMFGVGRVGAILGPYLIGWLLTWSGGSTAVVFATVAVTTAGGAAVALLLRGQRRVAPRTTAEETVVVPTAAV
jgi:AAHS family 4-hydroxybenzoate transporter-like MFS transporter